MASTITTLTDSTEYETKENSTSTECDNLEQKEALAAIKEIEEWMEKVFSEVEPPKHDILNSPDMYSTINEHPLTLQTMSSLCTTNSDQFCVFGNDQWSPNELVLDTGHEDKTDNNLVPVMEAVTLHLIQPPTHNSIDYEIAKHGYRDENMSEGCSVFYHRLYRMGLKTKWIYKEK